MQDRIRLLVILLKRFNRLGRRNHKQLCAAVWRAAAME
jgi:hypothetical protein